MTKLKYVKALVLVIFAVTLYSCINVDQKTVIKDDGSGTMVLHYWTKSVNVNIGDVKMGDDIGGFSFDGDQIKKKYSSEFTEVTNMKKYEMMKEDTTTHIEVSISFKDINKLSESLGFSNVKVSYVKGKDGMDFRYFIPKDTTIRLTYTTDKNTLQYTFEFSNEVIATNGTKQNGSGSNGSKEGNSVYWKFLTSDHAKQDLELTATIKNKGICGMFGMELPVVVLFGLFMLRLNSKKNINS